MSFLVYCIENEIGRNVASVGEMINTNILQKTLRRVLETSSCTWEDNIEMDLTLILCLSVDTIHPDQGSLQWRILVSMLRKCRDEREIVPKELFFMQTSSYDLLVNTSKGHYTKLIRG